MTAMNFEDYNLAPSLLEALVRRGFSEPTPVQDQVLSQPDLDADMVVQARTGSGKTLAFLLPLLNQISGGGRKTKILILSPTRELAMQSAGEAQYFGRVRGLETASIVGGMAMDHQIIQLRRGASVVVGTPGRVLDHLRRRTLDLSEVDTVVLDEGDNMLDLGFRDELEAILDEASGRRRTWVFSATMPEEILSLCRRYLTDPIHLTLDQDEDQHEDIVHRAYLVPSRQRMEALVNILLWEHPSLCLVFCHTRNDTAEVAERLQKEGFLALTLHGDMSQRERNSALFSFRSGRIPILVATNVAARGLDIQGVSHVIQLGLPESMETFVHRSGRTGRAGHEGSNLLVLTPQESGRFKFMLRSSRMKVQWLKVPDEPEIRTIQRELREEALLAQEPEPEIRDWAQVLLNRCGDPLELAAKLLTSAVKDLPKGYSLREALQVELDRRKGSLTPRRESRFGRRESSERGVSGERFTGKGVSIRICKGRNDEDWSVGRILGALCSTLGVDRKEIGNIRMRDRHTEVELSPLAQERLDQGGRERLLERGLISQGQESPAVSSMTPLKEFRFDRDRRFDRRDRSSRGRSRYGSQRAEGPIAEFRRRARQES